MTGGSNSHETTSEEANGIATDFVAQGIIGTYTNTSGVAPSTGAFAVNAQGTPDMTVAVSSGVAYVRGTPTSQNSQMFRVYNSASTDVTISANASGSTKYDWVYIKLDATLLNAPTLAGTTTATLMTSRSTSASTDDGTPPTYGYCIAVVTVANGASSITNSMIRDVRINSVIGASTSASTSWTSGVLPAVSSVTYNGNRSYTIVYASTVASILSRQARLKTTRLVAAPTRCTSLNGTTQYWVKTSPNKLTFTDDFVVDVWVKPSSYTTGTIVSRYNGTSGWRLDMLSTGQIQLIGFNAGVGNNSYLQSYQSIALNKWTHVTAQLDMSTFTATPTTSYVMIDGTDVPILLGRMGTNPTALVQAGNLEIGSANTGTLLFPGKIAQVAIFNAKVTQATIRGYISQGLLGTETSLTSAYSFNNSVTDLNTTTPNDLSVGGGAATATNADSPFTQDDAGVPTASTDVALVQSVSTTTVVVQVPEGCTIPTSGGVSATAYSTAQVPYGFTMDKGRWQVGVTVGSIVSASGSLAATVYNPGGLNLNVPIGTWDFVGDVMTQQNPTSTVSDMYVGYSTSGSSFSDYDLQCRNYQNSLTAGSLLIYQRVLSKRLTISAATPYYVLIYNNVATSSAPAIRGNIAANSYEVTKIYVTPAGI